MGCLCRRYKVKYLACHCQFFDADRMPTKCGRTVNPSGSHAFCAETEVIVSTLEGLCPRHQRSNLWFDHCRWVCCKCGTGSQIGAVCAKPRCHHACCWYCRREPLNPPSPSQSGVGPRSVSAPATQRAAALARAATSARNDFGVERPAARRMPASGSGSAACLNGLELMTRGLRSSISDVLPIPLPADHQGPTISPSLPAVAARHHPPNAVLPNRPPTRRENPQPRSWLAGRSASGDLQACLRSGRPIDTFQETLPSPADTGPRIVPGSLQAMLRYGLPLDGVRGDQSAGERSGLAHGAQAGADLEWTWGARRHRD